jgi:chemotaxis protein CheD
MSQIVVGVADCQVGSMRDQVLTTYALGSCIGLAVYDPAALVGGLLHFMLPDSGINPERGKQSPYMFADTGIPLLLQQVIELGASKRRLIVRAAGAARMMDPEDVFEVGRRNYLAMRRVLWKAGVLIHGEAVGGDRARTVRLSIGTGRFWLQEDGEEREIGPGCFGERAGSWHIAS